MLWIECHDGELVNMAHVQRITEKHYMVGTESEPPGNWLILYVAGDSEPVKVAHENPVPCKQMKYRIQTYLGLDVDYNDRNIIRHSWLTHKLP